jgi:hypothetical protein
MREVSVTLAAIVFLIVLFGIFLLLDGSDE